MEAIVVIEGVTFISSRRVAEITGYTQDYVGQLIRSGQIKARKIGRHWFVAQDSLEAYQGIPREAPLIAPLEVRFDDVAEDTLVYDGKEHISATRASLLSGYSRDYIGQLARSGIIPGRQLNGRWFVDEMALSLHKREKDALLAQVQAESVGLKLETASKLSTGLGTREKPAETLRYTRDGADLYPVLQEEIFLTSDTAASCGAAHAIPIRRSKNLDISDVSHAYSKYTTTDSPRGSAFKQSYWFLLPATFTVVIFISFGIVGLKDDSKYVQFRDRLARGVASVGVIESINSATITLEALRDLARPPLIYSR